MWFRGGSKRARRPKHTRSLTTARHVSEVLELAICDKDSSVVRIKPLYVTCSTRPIMKPRDLNACMLACLPYLFEPIGEVKVGEKRNSRVREIGALVNLDYL